ncbi:hypothetical protein NE237_027421 [Protea cynaroides]|uniref:Uncharacterized protein n=1 Tax=Protea cynaroides TaxID=273540 RepID=A0A9Q0GRU6_9MAGN|nr:hypothetical protein NE237_027421 [Protea cynaroides]
MDTVQIPSKNSAFRPYKWQSPTVATMDIKLKNFSQGEDKRAFERNNKKVESLDLNGSPDDITMVNDAIEFGGREDGRVLKRKGLSEKISFKICEMISGSSTAELQNNFMEPACACANKKIRMNAFGSKSKNIDSLGSLEIEDRDHDKETMLKIRYVEIIPLLW